MPENTLHEIAAWAATGFQLFQCIECAENVKGALQAAGHHGRWIEIRSAGIRRFMVCISFDGGNAAISQNGRHVGVRVGDLVFDNLHPGGMQFDQWLQDFDAVGGVVVTATMEF